MKCPNKNSPEWKELVDTFGEELAYFYHDISENPETIADGVDQLREKAIDMQIKKLGERLASLETVSAGANRKEIETRKNLIKASMRRLSEDRTYEKLAEVSMYQIKQISKILKKDPAEVTAFNLYEAIKVVSDLRNVTKVLALSPNLEVKKSIETINNWATALDLKTKELIKDMVLGVAKKHTLKVDPEEIYKSVKDSSWLAGQTLSTATSNIPLVQLVENVITHNDRVTNEMFDNNFKKPLEDLLKSLGKKKFETSDFNSILDSDKNLENPFSQSYYKERTNLWKNHYQLLNEYSKDPDDTDLKAKLTASFANLFTWYVSNHEYYLTKEGIAEFEKDLEDRVQAFTEPDGTLTAEGKRIKQEFMAQYSPYLIGKYDETTGKISVTAKNTPFSIVNNEKVYNSNWHRYLVAKPVEKWNNPKFDAVTSNKLYEFIVNKYLEALRMMPHETALDVGNFYKFLEDLNFSSVSSEISLRNLFSGIQDIAKETFTISITLADLEGAEIQRVFNPDGTYKDIYKPILKTKDDKGRPVPVLKPSTLEDIRNSSVFKNPIEILESFYKTALTYQHKASVMPVLQLLQHEIENLSAVNINPIGVILKDAFGKPDETTEAVKNASEQSRYRIVSYISGRTRMDESKGTLITETQKAKLKEATEKRLKGEPAPTIDVFSSVKTLDAVVDYTRMTLIGLKPFTAASNLIIGLFNNYIYASREKDFKDVHLDKAFRMLWGNMMQFYKLNKVSGTLEQAEKISNISEKFGITNSLYENADPNSMKRAKNKLVKFFYGLQEGGEFLIANQLLLAMMFNTEITDNSGKKTTLFEALDKEGNLKPEFSKNKEWSSVEVLNEQGENISKLNDFMNRLTSIRHRTQGDYSIPMQAKSKVLGRVLMMFRTWLPQALRERFGKENELLGFKGRYLSFWDTVKKIKGTKGKLQFLGKTGLTTLAKMTNLLPLGKYRFTKLSDWAGTEYDAYLKSIGASDLDVENMRANLKELDLLLTMTIVSLALTSLKKGDGGDDDDKYTINFLINLANRTQQDLTFFMWPPSAMAIIKDPIPLWKTIQETGDVLAAAKNYLDSSKDPRFQRGIHEGELKIWKEVKDLLPIFSAIQSTQSTVSKVFGQDAYRYTDKR